MKRLIVLWCIVNFLLILTGCSSDEKQAATIQKIIGDSTKLEEDFYTVQKDLLQSKEEAQLLYHDLVNMEIMDKASINEKVEEAITLIEKQQSILEDSKDSFESAYHQFLTIEKSIQKLKDDNYKKQASELLAVMNEREQLLDSFFTSYQDNLEAQQTFYTYLKEENYSFKVLDEQINEINERNQAMVEIIEQFNDRSRQYVEQKNEYNQMIG